MLSEITNFLILIQTKNQKGGVCCQKHEARLKELDKKNQRKTDKSTIGKLTLNQFLYLNKQATI